MIGMRMDADGGSCFPSIAELAALTGLDKKTVRKHVSIAVVAGWLEVMGGKFGGQRWRRQSYRARWPDDFEGGEKVADMGMRKGGEGGGRKVGENRREGGGIGARKVGEPFPQDKNTPINSPRARANAHGTVPGAASPERVVAGYCGKLWMAHRFWLLMQPPEAVTMTVVDKWRLETGRASYDELMQARRRDAGWPDVNEMISISQKRDRKFYCGTALMPVASGFVGVRPRTDIFVAWRRLHDRRGWPFLSRPADWVYFPPLANLEGDLDEEVEAAFAAFAIRANELMNEGAGAEEN